VFCGEEIDDDVPRDERNSMVTMAASIFSRGGSRRRLEMRVATMCFGRAPARRSTAQKNKMRVSRGAPEREESRGT
jgi:hypothetical protein